MNSFTEQDINYFNELGISIDKVTKYLEYFKKGFPYTHISKPCLINDGIHTINENNINDLILRSEKASSESRLMKFVPASGAASRMFKTLNYFYNNYDKILESEVKLLSESGDNEAKELYKFILGIKKFAFFEDLKNVMSKNGFDINDLIYKGDYKEIIDFLLNEKGLNYANLPKALLKFHKYENEIRTSIEEHLVEGAVYTKDKNNNVNIHFTISPEHFENIESYINDIKSKYEDRFNVKFNISFSVQKKSSDTLAVDLENNPFYDEGQILFRPGGHGALIENLNDLNADIVFIKNIDNVVPDNLKEETYKYKKALAGHLIDLQDKSFKFLNDIDADTYNCDEIFNFLEKDLFIYIPENIKTNKNTQKEFLINKLNRPLRVCGMVRNQGEPGGGPFWVKTNDTYSVQIVETSQVDLTSTDQKNILNMSSHFNPVDLVCGLKDYKGNNFNLEKFIDYNTGFISKKSKDGRDLKALELPGLWNGAMAYWNTIFVEVPLITFNPVKTVNDLLRPEHQ